MKVFALALAALLLWIQAPACRAGEAPVIEWSEREAPAAAPSRIRELQLLNAYGGHTYALFDGFPYTWTEAEDYCESLGGHLVCVADADEQAHVASMVRQGGKPMYWIGGRRDESGSFVWLDGTRVGDDNPFWDRGQPDNSDNDGEGRREDYMQIFRDPNPDAGRTEDGEYRSEACRWNDNVNDNSYGASSFFTIDNVGFVCEWDSDIIGYSFRLFEDPAMTWTEARDFCLAQGGCLACVDTAEKQAAVEALIADGEKGMYWIGGFRDDQGEYAWLNGSGVGGGYQNWDAGAPDNYRENEGYMQMFRLANPKVGKSRAFAWNDAPEDNVIEDEAGFFDRDNVGFVCEFRELPWD